MSVRKREWTTAKGERKSAWVVAYTAQAGKRHLKTFSRKKDADAFEARVTVEVSDGTHTAASQSVRVRDAGDKWIATAEKNGLERSTIEQYRTHLRVHINPYLGSHRLSELILPRFGGHPC